MKVMDIFKVVHQMGLPWTFFRGHYEFKRRTGLLKKKFPVTLYLDGDIFERSMAPCIDSKESMVNYLRENRGDFCLILVISINMALFRAVFSKPRHQAYCGDR